MKAAAFWALISAACALVGWFFRQIGAAALKQQKDADDAISRAKQARDIVRAANDRDPASVLRDDDGFKRPD